MARRPSCRDLCRAFCRVKRPLSSLPRDVCNRQRDLFVLPRSVFEHQPAFRSPNRTDRVLHRAFCARRSPSCSRLDVIFFLPTASSRSTTDFSSPKTASCLRKRDLSFTQPTAFLTLRAFRVLRPAVFWRLPHFFHRSSSISGRRPGAGFHFSPRADWQRTFYERPGTFLHRRRPGRSWRRTLRFRRTRFSVLQSPRPLHRWIAGPRLRLDAPRLRRVSSSRPRFVVWGGPSCSMQSPSRSTSKPALEDPGPAGDSPRPSLVTLRPRDARSRPNLVRTGDEAIQQRCVAT